MEECLALLLTRLCTIHIHIMQTGAACWWTACGACVARTRTCSAFSGSVNIITCVRAARPNPVHTPQQSQPPTPQAKSVPTKVVLTKGDLLGAEALARSHALVAADAAALGVELVAWDEDGGVAMVSSGTGAGVTALWKGLVAWTRRDSVYRGDIGYHRAAVH